MDRPSFPLTLLLLLTAGVSQAADKVVGGPYVVHATSRSATVMWLVEGGPASIGTAPDKLAPVAGSVHAEKVDFTDLQPGTKYYYNVTGTDAGKGSFKTAPAAGAPFRFVVFGDTRTRHDVHRRVIQEILRYPVPDFAIHTGDLVANGHDASLWPIFFDIEHDLLRQTAFFPSLGNHERNDRRFYDFFDTKTSYYSFDWGNAHFIILDSDIGNVAATDQARKEFWDAQVRWLERDLARTQSADFRFVVAHHPPITAVRRRQGSNKEMKALMPLFEKYHVTAGFFGHDHNYQHYFSNNVHYITTGGGGAPLYDVDLPPPGITRKVARVENFVSVTVTGKTARVEARSVNDEILDAFELRAAAQ